MRRSIPYRLRPVTTALSVLALWLGYVFIGATRCPSMTAEEYAEELAMERAFFQAKQTAPNSLKIVFNAPFETVGGKLSVEPIGPQVDPYEARLRLVFRTKDSMEIIRDFSKLKGKVRLGSAEDALAFVRLLTCPGTFFLFTMPGWTALEVIAREEIPSYYNFGNHLEDIPLDAKDGYCGVVSRKTVRSLGLPLAEVKEEEPSTEGKEAEAGGEKTWIVTRTLLIEERDSWLRLQKVVERVTSSGGYVVLSRKTLPRSAVHAITWVVPRFL